MLAEVWSSEEPSAQCRLQVYRAEALFGPSLICLYPASLYSLCSFSALSLSCEAIEKAPAEAALCFSRTLVGMPWSALGQIECDNS